MARIEVKMPEAFLLKVSKLADSTDAILPKVLKAGGEVVLQKVKNHLQSVIGQKTKESSRSTGELENALGVSPAKMDRDGNYNIKIGFSEPRSDGASNAKIANIIEYGKHGQPAQPFLKPERSSSRKACMDAMAEKLDEEIKNLCAFYPN